MFARCCAPQMDNGEMSPNPGGLFLGPVRRPLRADSEFFVAGNTNRELFCKISVFSIMSGGGGHDAMDLAEHQQSYACVFQGCSATFSSFQRVSLYRPVVRVQPCPTVYFAGSALRGGTASCQGRCKFSAGSRCCHPDSPCWFRPRPAATLTWFTEAVGGAHLRP